MKNIYRGQAALLFAGLLLFAATGLSNKHEEYQINVIRPKFFVKKSRTEFGADIAAIINQTFTYTYLLSGTLVYHLTDSWALGATGAYGHTVDKEDKRVLKSKFGITVDIFRMNWFAEGSLLWTPVYGKYQLASGRLVYFDTYISAGFGMMGIETNLSEKDGTGDPYNCYSPVIGAGQRFYLNKRTSLRWQIRDHIIWYDGTKCLPEEPSNADVGYNFHHTIVTQIGISYFI